MSPEYPGSGPRCPSGLAPLEDRSESKCVPLPRSPGPLPPGDVAVAGGRGRRRGTWPPTARGTAGAVPVRMGISEQT